MWWTENLLALALDGRASDRFSGNYDTFLINLRRYGASHFTYEHAYVIYFIYCRKNRRQRDGVMPNLLLKPGIKSMGYTTIRIPYRTLLTTHTTSPKP